MTNCEIKVNYKDLPKTYLRSILEENQTQSIKLLIIKVDKYPEWKQPQLSKILDNVLNDAAANETIEKLKEDTKLLNQCLMKKKRNLLLFSLSYF